MSQGGDHGGGGRLCGGRLGLVVGAVVVDGSLVVVVAPVDAFAAMKIPVPTPTTRTAASQY